MKFKISIFFLAFVCVQFVAAQKKKDVFMTIDDSPIYASEFSRVFKKNLDLVQDESQKSVDGYLDLFIDYKLKIAEAKEQGLTETRTFKRDFKKYQNQLSKNYLYEDKITQEVAKEAFERSLEEIEASHLLIAVSIDAPAADTLKAYNKIASYRKRAVAGEDFTSLVKKYSDEPRASDHGGYLNYFSAFTMVYPFETEAYKTKVGQVSEIVRTKFGYHIINVTDRRQKDAARKVSHIMISTQNKQKPEESKNKIVEIKTLLEQGQSFESLAEQFSDDKNSGKRGGSLKAFSRGELRSPKFEKAAFDIKKLDDVVGPVASEFGWHLIKLDSILPVPTFAEKKKEFEKRVEDGNRNKIITKAVNNTIRKKYNYEKVNDYIPFFMEHVSDSILKRKWKKDTIFPKDNRVIFTLKPDTEVRFLDFQEYLGSIQPRIKISSGKKAIIETAYEEFETKKLKEHFIENLKIENDDYAAVLGEYRDGLLIFDVMKKNIWDKAQQDSIGLNAFYDTNTDRYQWKERVTVDMISATSQQLATQVQQMFKEEKDAQTIKEALLDNENATVILTSGTFEIDSDKLPDGFKAEEGVSAIYKDVDSYVVANVKLVAKPSPKNFEDIKGRVTSDYQNKIEAEWIKSLRKKYDVNVNKKVLKKLRKKLDS